MDDVALDIEHCASVPVYSVRTEYLSFPVVERVTLFSTTQDVHWPFELALEDAAAPDEMLYVRGPFESPLDLDKAMEGARVVASGSVEKINGTARWSEHEYEYEYDGALWRQRLYALSLRSRHSLTVAHEFVMTAQCRRERSGPVFALADALAAGIANER